VENTEHKTVVVTGSSSGIGFATAKRLAERGRRVFATVRREEDVERLLTLGIEGLIPLCLDVTRSDSVADASEKIGDLLGDAGLDALINNAGYMLAAPLEVTPIEVVRHHFDVNVTGHLAVIQALLPHLRPVSGRIVNIGSISGRVSTPYSGPYNASKAALRAMTDALRVELSPWGIAVSLIEPGTVLTPMWNNTRQRIEALRREVPPESGHLYDEVFERIPEFIDNAQSNGQGMSAEQVARIIERILEVRRPRAHYVIGMDARLRWLLTLLPTRLRDRLIGVWIERYGSSEQRAREGVASEGS
jgi:NAD(P)-dependent dehydrogenase (short-subunit alcohol dehydrogenase family)